MIIAGIGCRHGAHPDAVIAAVEAALAQNGLAPSQLGGLATSADKGGENGIAEAARQLTLRLVLVPQTALRNAAAHALTSSPRVEALKGVPSLAECAALAAAGDGARLIARRLATPTVTCALAEGGDA